METTARARLWSIVGLWAQRVFAGLIGAALLLLLGPAVVSAIRSAVPLSAPWWWSALALLPLAGFAYSLASRRWKAFLGIAHFGTYPPLWVSALIGLTCVAAVCGWSPCVAATIGLDAIAQALIRRHFRLALACECTLIVLAVLGWFWIRLTAPPQPATLDQPKHDLRTPDGLLAWIRDDLPISSPCSDAFELNRIAERIVRRLNTQEAVKPPAMAIIGELGSGKTSVLNLVLHSAGTRHRQRIVPVQLWPYETLDAAITGILEALVSAVHAEVGVSDLRGMPREYIQLIAGGGGFWATLSDLFGTPSKPRDILRRIDQVATILHLRYVLWVEDLERFADTPKRLENLGPIRALFHLIDTTSAVSLILASSRIHDEFDMPKLARYIEALPELPLTLTRHTIDQFRQLCLADLARHGDIDAASKSLRDQLADVGDVSLSNLRAYAVPGTYKGGLLSSLASLCRTPRLLKSGLRRCLETWTALRGEVDFDDLLIMSVLREAEPSVFGLMANHVNSLTEVGMAVTKTVDGKESAFDRAFADVEITGPSRTAIRSLLYFVFPDQAVFRKPQGLCFSEPRDYWRRFLAVPALPEHELDQPILKVCSSAEDAAIIDQLEDPAKSEVTEQFLYRLAGARDSQITATRLTHMLQLVVAKRLEEAGNDWNERVPPSLTPLWNLLGIRANVGDLGKQHLATTLAQSIADSATANVQLLEQLDYWFLFTQNGPTLLATDDVQRLIDLVGASLLARHQDNPAGLAAALRRGDSWALRRIVDRHQELASADVPWPTWSALATLLLEAADKFPTAVFPTLAALVVNETRVPGEYVYSRERAEVLFGHARIRRLISDHAAEGVDNQSNARLVRVMTQMAPTSENATATCEAPGQSPDTQEKN